MILLWAFLFLVLALEVRAGPRLEPGMVSRDSLRAPERLTYTSILRTDRARDRAAGEVNDIFSPPDRSLAVQQVSNVEAIARFIDAVRADAYATESQKERYLSEIQLIQFAPDQIDSILTLPDPRWQLVVDETVRLVDRKMRGEIREGTMNIVLSGLPQDVDLELADEESELVLAWASSLIIPNTYLDTERTEQARNERRSAVAPVEQTYEAEQIIIREGEIVTPEQVEALQQFGLYQPQRAATEYIGIGIFALLLALTLTAYMVKEHHEFFTNFRIMGWLLVTLVGLAVGIRWVMTEHPLLAYLLPTATTGMLLGVLLGVDVAVVVTVVIAMLVGFVTNSLELIVYTLIGGVIASLSLKRVERLGVFVWTGFLVGVANVAVIVTFALSRGIGDWYDLASAAGVGMINGAASASLALGGFYVLSNLVGITTFIQLMDLSRPNHPLFRELLLNAPGTYHHSIVVSNLSEAAAEAIGADMLLVRVGAYYHDVGKIKNPHFFVENQTEGVNAHDTLNDPYKSAEIIVGHVKEGVALAKKHRVPGRIQDFIRQHHGTTTVAFFLAKAIERDGAALVDESRFHYTGPKPQWRETAILMLADSVEAVTRAKKPTSIDSIDKIVRDIITERLTDGQLDECTLTLLDLNTIREAFVKVLQGIYHPRIAYPDKVKAAPIPLIAAPEPALRPALPGDISHEPTEPYRNPG